MWAGSLASIRGKTWPWGAGHSATLEVSACQMHCYVSAGGCGGLHWLVHYCQGKYKALTQSTKYRNNRFASEYYFGYSEHFCVLACKRDGNLIWAIYWEVREKKSRKKKQKKKLSSSRGSKIVNQLVLVQVFLVKPVVWVFHQHTYYSQQPDIVILLLWLLNDMSCIYIYSLPSNDCWILKNVWQA